MEHQTRAGFCTLRSADRCRNNWVHLNLAPTFSEQSYGFRPGHLAHQAVSRAQNYVAAGYRWIVDFDLEEFFDRVNHDRLMAQLARRIVDKRLLKLIRGFLRAGVMANGLVSPIDEGTPQGGSR